MSTSDPYAVFRPRRGRVVALVAGSIWLVSFVGLALFMPGRGDTVDELAWGPLDRVLMSGLGLLGSSILLRYGLIRAVPTPDGLRIRNLFRSARVEWAEVVAVRFGGGAPWVSLDLSDTSDVAVMAIQRSDGEHARREASRLRTLADHHGAPRPAHPEESADSGAGEGS